MLNQLFFENHVVGKAISNLDHPLVVSTDPYFRGTSSISRAYGSNGWDTRKDFPTIETTRRDLDAFVTNDSEVEGERREIHAVPLWLHVCDVNAAAPALLKCCCLE